MRFIIPFFIVDADTLKTPFSFYCLDEATVFCKELINKLYLLVMI